MANVGRQLEQLKPPSGREEKRLKAVAETKAVMKRAEVCVLVSAGCGIERAARYVGCNPSTIRREAIRNRDFHEQLR